MAWRLVDDLEATRQDTLRYFDLGERDLARRYAPGKWPVRFYDQDAWAARLDYSVMPLDISRGIYASVRSAVIYLAEHHYTRHGDREFVHSDTGVRTLADEFNKVAAHNAHHLDQIRKALS